MKAVFCAPTSFFARACLRQAVRLACFAAASLSALEGGVVAGAAGFAGSAGVLAGASSLCTVLSARVPAIDHKINNKATAGNKERMAVPRINLSRIAAVGRPADEARMKLA
jgi:hypothetical protein